MGASDIVPGVSGGTIALVLGFYETLLDTVYGGAKFLAALVKLDFTSAKQRFLDINFAFAIPLGVGLLSALAILTPILDHLLENEPERIAGFFFGLVVASIVVAWGLLKGDQLSTQGVAVITAAAGAVAFFLLGFQSGPVADPPIWLFFGSGLIAICAMILPGISGSFILLMMGMYAAVLGAIHDRDILPILVFSVGAIIGLAIFSSFLNNLLAKYHDLVLALLIGLMIGSLRVLWPWPNGVGIISEEASESVSGTALGLPEGEWLSVLGLGVLAFGLVIFVTQFAAEKTSSN